ncbi:pre-mRNA-splicing factor SYF1-like [Symsagittifera roscoffensis]|uniref:pre-mRNA-splicing factor SYF1-like n=1 Tax=Symsagittifera roscoffensis TaxID=84072 RepID=UPI00307BB5D7
MSSLPGAGETEESSNMDTSDQKVMKEPAPEQNSIPVPDELELTLSEQEYAYEEEIIRNPYVVKGWLRYAEFKRNAPQAKLNMVYERAVKQLPGSFKLWMAYLRLRKQQVRGRCVTDTVFEDVNNTFERSLVFMFKMPRVWLEYLKFLMDQKKVTRCRHAFDRALRALPVTQHVRIWKLYLQFIQQAGVPHETTLRVWRRYLKLAPDEAEDFIEFLVKIGHLDEAVTRLADLVNDSKFESKKGKSKFQLWNYLCDLLSKHPFQVTSLDSEAIIRQGIGRFTDQRGTLWCALADYYIRAGLFDRARDIYMEAVHAVVTVRDFTQVFDAYVVFEESLIKHLLGKQEKGDITEAQKLELELMLTRYEEMIMKRPLYLNSVLLRQNPHNVADWMKRAEILESKPLKVIKTYSKAIDTIDPKQALGKFSELFMKFAKFYLDQKHVEEARMVYEKATQVPFKQVEELANIWCEYAEMEINLGNHEKAMKLMQRATTPPAKKAAYFDSSEPAQNRVYRSLKIWSLYADLEESMGTFRTAKAVYDAIIDLRIATPQIIMNYALFLEENNYFEESFKAFEKGIALFKWPNVYDIWHTYLSKFIQRYKGQKLERTRDLFEQCVEGIPKESAKSVYLMYAKMEEDYGMSRHAMAILDRATLAVKPEEQFEVFEIYLKKAADYFGITHCREIYEKAIDVLTDDGSKIMCLRFAELETKLGEVDRARAIYAHCSQICDPRTSVEFWTSWKNFEVKHGNEDTLREMLRIKRSVQATFNTKVNYITSQIMEKTSENEISDDLSGSQIDSSMSRNSTETESNNNNEPKSADEKSLSQSNYAAKENIMFVSSSSNSKILDSQKVVNPNEMNLDDSDEEKMDDDQLEENEKTEVVKRNVPASVFGSLITGGQNEKSETEK